MRNVTCLATIVVRATRACDGEHVIVFVSCSSFREVRREVRGIRWTLRCMQWSGVVSDFVIMVEVDWSCSSFEFA